MHEITVPWAKLQYPEKWPDNYENEIWDETKCPAGGTAIDIGAHYGLYTTKMAHDAGPEGQVLAFEPNETNLKILVNNLKINNISSIVYECAVSDYDQVNNLKLNDLTAIIYNCALSNYEGEGTLYTYGLETDSGKNFLRGSLEQEAFYQEHLKGKPVASPEWGSRVKVTMLDEIAPKLERIDLIKMDIEGAELKMIEGARLTLQKHSPKLVIEVHFNLEENLKELLSNFGYSMVRYYPKVTFSSNPFAIFEVS